MAELVDIISQSLNGIVDACGRAESEQLQAQVAAAKELAKGGKVIDVVDDLLAKGKPADFLVAAKASLHGSLAIATRTTTAVSAGGTVGGATPVTVQIHADYANNNERDTTTNADITVELERVSQTKSVDDLASRLIAMAQNLGVLSPQLPTPTAPATVPTTTTLTH